MELFGRQVPLLYIFLIPYIPFVLFILILFMPLLFIWIIADMLTNYSLGFFSVMRMLIDFVLPPIKICPPSLAEKSSF
jgi:hypothetical protein